MVVRADNYMVFLEFLKLTNSNRWREVKERVDPLTKYNDSKLHPQTAPLEADCSPSSVWHMSDSSFAILIRSVYCENSENLHRHSYEWPMAFFRYHGLQPRPVPAGPAWPFSICQSLYQPLTLAGPLFTNVCRNTRTTTDLRRLIFTFWWSNLNIGVILGYKWNTKSIFFYQIYY